jgi:hypothetical protein
MTASPHTAPVPDLVINGTTAALAGVQFSWMCRCWSCRSVQYIYADGGSISAGLRASASRKTVRWFQTPEPPAMPALPASCPDCGERNAPFGSQATRLGPFSEDRRVLAHHNSLPVLELAWSTLRELHPALAQRADDHERRQARQ